VQWLLEVIHCKLHVTTKAKLTFKGYAIYIQNVQMIVLVLQQHIWLFTILYTTTYTIYHVIYHALQTLTLLLR